MNINLLDLVISPVSEVRECPASIRENLQHEMIPCVKHVSLDRAAKLVSLVKAVQHVSLVKAVQHVSLVKAVKQVSLDKAVKHVSLDKAVKHVSLDKTVKAVKHVSPDLPVGVLDQLGQTGQALLHHLEGRRGVLVPAQKARLY